MAERFRIPWTTGKFEISQPERTIVPPPELLKQWEDDWFQEQENADVLLVNAYAAGALAGADAELEACCEWLHWQNLATHPDLIPSLRAARRPKPPSLKEQALMALEDGDTGPGASLTAAEVSIIRRALEQLDD
jgi:hypothetical protein